MYHFQFNKKITLNYPKSAVMRCFPKGLEREFETAVVNEPSVFESLKFYCIGTFPRDISTVINVNLSTYMYYNSDE